ncbi:hypothetical protein MMC28_004699 [Mycoblastus sanguinarius]|nr:hypothetical protein [Mycoblastus sanguinarius]
MDLSGHDLDSVDRLVQWLYSKRYKLSAYDTEENTTRYFLQLGKLNTIADKYDIVDLKNDIIDQICALYADGEYPPYMPSIKYLYENTTNGSSFRKAVVAWYAWHIDYKWYTLETTREWRGNVPEFAIDLLIELGKNMAFPDRKNPLDSKPSVLYENFAPPTKTSEPTGKS